MLKNAYLLAKIGADTAENEQHSAEILPIGRRVANGSLASGGLDDLLPAFFPRDPAAELGAIYYTVVIHITINAVHDT